MNIYKAKRLEAAKYNEQLKSQKKAAEILPGVTEECLKNYEAGRYVPPKEVISIMARVYNAPELKLYYCSHECNLGYAHKDKLPSPELCLIRMEKANCMIDAILETVTGILDDGVVTDQEANELSKIKKGCDEVIARYEEFATVIEQLSYKREKAPQEVAAPIVLG